MEMPPPKIDNEATATKFVAACVVMVGPGYHPDTPFGEYLSEDGAKCFSDEGARRLDEATEAAFRYCDPYDVALTIVQQHGWA